ncbi:MAG: glycosyltransferase family 1 protein [Novosphingobium sp.]|nr:MAG: glycosyltransferase family 1 protein [Novosphingobium sp.]
MKVLVLSSFAFSLVNFRGALLQSMTAAGHSVIAAAPDDDSDVRGALADMGVRFRQVAMARAGVNPFRDLWTLLRYVALIRREKPDLVLAYTQKPIIYGGIAARLAGSRPFYALMSGLGYSFGQDARDRWVLRAIVRRLFREGMRRAKTIFVFNGDDRREMLEQGVIDDDAPVLQVPGSGIDLSQFACQSLPKGPPTFLMIARLMRDKGLFDFVEAARRVRKRFPEARFELLGRIDAQNPTSVSEAVVRDWQVEGLLTYRPETRDVRPHLAAATVFVLPSYHREGLPRTILEAMAIGRAVITTDMPGCREPVRDGVSGFLVPPQDPAALAAAMARFCLDPALAERMGAEGRSLAEARYDVHLVNALLLDAMKLRDPRAAWPDTCAKAVSMAGAG